MLPRAKPGGAFFSPHVSSAAVASEGGGPYGNDRVRTAFIDKTEASDEPVVRSAPGLGVDQKRPLPAGRDKMNLPLLDLHEFPLARVTGGFSAPWVLLAGRCPQDGIGSFTRSGLTNHMNRPQMKGR